MKPFGINGVTPQRWTRWPEWQDAPILDLPPRDTHLVVLAAHADDETLGVGGFLHAAGERLDRITVVVATDGSASHPDSPTLSPAELARRRRDEATEALAALAPGATLVQLGLPDGALADHEAELTTALLDVLGPDGDTWLLSTWLEDGHPDHAAAARAARTARAGRLRTRMLEYPVWFWHIGDPNAVPDTLAGRLRRFELAPADRTARDRAVAAYTSQVRPLSDRPGDEAVLPASFLAHAERDRDFLIDVGDSPAADAVYFDRIYAGTPDPWRLGSAWYEQRKRDLLLAALPRLRFRRAFEPGGARGDLSARLLDRIDELVCADTARAAVDATRARLGPAARVEQLHIPGEWPDGRFDLIVLSEVGYYVPDLARLSTRLTESLDPDGVLVLVHWRHAAPDHPHTAETVRATLRAATGWASLARHEEHDFLLDVLAPDPRSVAQHDGLV